MTTTADMDRLGHLCRLAAADVAAWEDEQELLRPDGHRASVRSSGMPTSKGGISDPTGHAAATAAGMDDTAIEVRATCGRITALAVAIATATLGHDPTDGALATSAVERLDVAALALTEAGKCRRLPEHVQWRGLTIATGDARDSLTAELVGLRTIVAAARSALEVKPCTGWGPTLGQCKRHPVQAGADPQTGTVQGVDDGLCLACREVKQWRCSCCGDGLDPLTTSQRPRIAGQHEACYHRARRGKAA